MRGDGFPKLFLGILVSGGFLFLWLPAAVAQESRSAPSSSASTSEAPAEMRALTELVRDLQTQVQTLNSQLADLQRQQERSSAETQDLRRELDRVSGQGAIVASGQGNSYAGYPVAESAGQPSSSASPAPPPQASPDRIDKLEENQEIMQGKIDDEYQTKVESGSKYRVRLSGIVLLNLYANRGYVDNQDWPEISERKQDVQPWASAGTFGGSLRQSQLRLQTFGPDIGGSRTRADVEFDFGGGFPQYANGVTMGVVRLRTATVRLEWPNTNVVAGQDRLFFAPLSPTSLATLATPSLSYSGNLWAWTPQLRVEHRFVVSENSSFTLQGGILDSLSGDTPPYEYARYPTWGEMSGQPAYAVRMSWSHRMFHQDFTVGASGYYGRQNWGYNDHLVDGWAGMADLTLPIGKRVEFTGAFYRGRAVAGIGGAMGQDIISSTNNSSGPIVTPTSIIRGLDSIGGWTQLKFRVKTNFEINGALGVDNPYAHELRLYSTPGAYTRNFTPMLNFIYQLRSDILFSTEYRYLKTAVLDGGSTSANHVNFSLGYIF